jgi:hypothetical protein
MSSPDSGGHSHNATYQLSQKDFSLEMTTPPGTILPFSIPHHPFDNCAWFQTAWRINLLKTILMNVVVPLGVLVTKV